MYNNNYRKDGGYPADSICYGQLRLPEFFSQSKEVMLLKVFATVALAATIFTGCASQQVPETAKPEAADATIPKFGKLYSHSWVSKTKNAAYT